MSDLKEHSQNCNCSFDQKTYHLCHFRTIYVHQNVFFCYCQDSFWWYLLRFSKPEKKVKKFLSARIFQIECFYMFLCFLVASRYCKKGFFKSIFFYWFWPHWNFPAKMTCNFSLKLIFQLVKFGWNWNFACLKLSKIHHFWFGIHWNAPFSCKLVYCFRRKKYNVGKITMESLTFEKTK